MFSLFLTVRKCCFLSNKDGCCHCGFVKCHTTARSVTHPVYINWNLKGSVVYENTTVVIKKLLFLTQMLLILKTDIFIQFIVCCCRIKEKCISWGPEWLAESLPKPGRSNAIRLLEVTTLSFSFSLPLSCSLFLSLCVSLFLPLSSLSLSPLLFLFSVSCSCGVSGFLSCLSVSTRFVHPPHCSSSSFCLTCVQC